MRSLRSILLLLTACGIMAATVITAASMWGFSRANDSAQRAFVAKDITADVLPPPLYLLELRLVLSQAVEGSISPSVAKSEVGRLEREYADRVQYWTRNPPYGLEARLLGKQHEAGQAFLTASKAVLAAVASEDVPAAQAALRKAHDVYSAHRAGVDETVKASNEFADSATKSLDESRAIAARLEWFVLAISGAVLVFAGMWARKTVWAATGGEPASAAAIANSVAKGDLSVDVEVQQRDSSSIMAALGRMCRDLANIVAYVRASSHSIACASSQLAQGGRELSRRTEAQASALEQTASAMEELTGNVQQNAENARNASKLAAGASDVATEGSEVFALVTRTMSSISDSSRRIEDIISVIDGIAFQTNILSLNAAVEAARAGEEGRGFAVVASEVRGLAQRSAGAAKEIKQLIEASASEVQEGTRLVGLAGGKMEEIVVSIKRVHDIMDQISAASNEQSAAIDQVNQAIAEMDQTTQQNAALVEQAAAATESMETEARGLNQAVSIFRLAPAQAAG